MGVPAKKERVLTLSNLPNGDEISALESLGDPKATALANIYRSMDPKLLKSVWERDLSEVGAANRRKFVTEFFFRVFAEPQFSLNLLEDAMDDPIKFAKLLIDVTNGPAKNNNLTVNTNNFVLLMPETAPDVDSWTVEGESLPTLEDSEIQDWVDDGNK